MNKESKEKDAIRMKEYDETESETESDVMEYVKRMGEILDNKIRELTFRFNDYADGGSCRRDIEERLIDLERAIEGIERKAKMVRRDADSGGDTEWY